MPHIQQLPAHVADLIAAGEVVERPASVVKELVENAIDAGATAIVVEIRRGGMGMIRVTDNGCGIDAAELPTAFLRHATSKLRKAEDLSSIGTLGFRGEALAAISAVSRIDVLTTRRDETIGAALHIEGGEAGIVEEAGAPEGTTITVQDLFYNTPARLKFMKKDSAETAAVSGLVQHLALSHPDISFRFIKDGTETLHTPGDGKLDSAIYAALGRDFARSLLPVSGRGGEVEVRGFITQPLMGRGSRGMQVFFVNGRFIKSQLLTAALEEGYRNQLMKGKFPGCVLCVTLPVTLVDVNVHPAKTQVKFAREKEVFDAVYHTVLDTLDGPAPTPASVSAPKSTPLPTVPRQDFFRTMDAKTYREQESRPAVAPRQAARTWDTEWKSTARVADSVQSKPRESVLSPRPAMGALGTPPASVVPPCPAAVPTVKAAAPVSAARPESPASPRAETFTAPRLFVAAAPTEEPPKAEVPSAAADQPEVQQTMEPEKEAPWRIAGEILNTYVVCEAEDGCVYLVDKHAAHERVNFDRLMATKEPPMRQTLLQPIAAELGREDAALLLENTALLEQMGFACEDFGDGTVLVRELPADLEAGTATTTLEEFAELLRSGRSLEEKREALLHTMACKAAIKGGWVSDRRELEVLVEKVQSGEVRYCPHGRPVAVKLTKYEIEKMFKRA